jgi:hypothetical protein
MGVFTLSMDLQVLKKYWPTGFLTGHPHDCVLAMHGYCVHMGHMPCANIKWRGGGENFEATTIVHSPSLRPNCTVALASHPGLHVDNKSAMMLLSCRRSRPHVVD